MANCLRSELATAHDQLLTGGVARKYADRAVREWQDHLEALTRNHESEGTLAEEAVLRAKRQFGDLDALVDNMLQREELKTCSRRFPRLVFLLTPLLALLVSVAAIALSLVLTSVLLKNSQWVEGGGATPLLWMANLSFGFVSFGLTPAIVSVFCVLARRRRVPLAWPVLGVVIVSIAGAGWDYSIMAPGLETQGVLQIAWGWGALGIPVPEHHDTQVLAKLVFAAVNALAILCFYRPRNERLSAEFGNS